MLPLLILLSCSKDPGDATGIGGPQGDADSDTDTDTDTDTDVDSDTGDASGPWDSGGDPEGTLPAIRVVSSVTWTLLFDEEAQDNGYSDCTYTREYEGLQTLTLPWLCPECDVILRGYAEMTDGEECYALLSSGDPSRMEMWGWSGTMLYRSGNDQGELGDLAEFEEAEDGEPISIAWESDYTLTSGGAMVLSASGTMTRTEDEETLLDPDPWPEITEPYGCGWPQANPGTLGEPDYRPEQGGIFPNVRLTDQCGEQVDLWDLYGNYLVLDNTQSDCGPCRNMASGAEEALALLRDEGIDVMAVSIMGNGLSHTTGTPTSGTVESWVEAYGLQDPVLADRGFGPAVFPGYIYDFSGEDYGYPAWIIVDPQMRIIYGNVGFSTWDVINGIIEEDWAGR